MSDSLFIRMTLGFTEEFVQPLYVQTSRSIEGMGYLKIEQDLLEVDGIVSCDHKNKHLLVVGVSSIHATVDVMAATAYAVADKLLTRGHSAVKIQIAGPSLANERDLLQVVNERYGSDARFTFAALLGD